MARGRTKGPLAEARRKYSLHKAQSKFRNIPFLFEFDAWYAWWLQQGIDKNVDTFSKSNTQRACMCRFNDTGAYEPTNVYCASQIQNLKDAQANKVHLRANYAKNYRWGNSLININELRQLVLGPFQPDHYRANRYDYWRKSEARQLMNRFTQAYGKLRTRTQYHNPTTGEWYPSRLAVSKSMRIDSNTYAKRLQNREPGYATRVTHTLKDYILKHSRYPDPIIPQEQ